MTFQSRRPFNGNPKKFNNEPHSYEKKAEPFKLFQTDEMKAKLLNQTIEKYFTPFQFGSKWSVKDACDLASVGAIGPIDVGLCVFEHYLENGLLREVLRVVPANIVEILADLEFVHPIPDFGYARVSKEFPATAMQLQEKLLRELDLSGRTISKRLATLAFTWKYASPPQFAEKFSGQPE